MGIEVVEQVLAAIQAMGLRAERGFPQGHLPVLTAPVAVVTLDRLVPRKGITEVRIQLLSPWETGGAACENLGMDLTAVLAAEGAWCTQEACRQFEGQKLLCVPILASFQEAEPEPESVLAVSIGTQALPGVVGFTAWQETDETVTSLDGALWHFTLEELLTESGQQVVATEPFVLQVTSAAGTETYQSCTLVSQSREVTAEGLRWIRKGAAQSRV